MSHKRPAGALHAIVNGLSAGILLLVFGIGALTFAVPAIVGGQPLSVLTSSMSPTLPPGTLVIVKPTPIEEIAVGDVLTYQLESGKATLVTHRVVARTATSADEVTFTTQGDANGSPDAEPVLPVQVRGTVWYAIPWLGWVNQAVNGSARSWLIPLAAGALFVYAAGMLVSGLRDRYVRRSPASDSPSTEGSRT